MKPVVREFDVALIGITLPSPNVMIMESSIPCAYATVAAPILKLCPTYKSGSSWALNKAALSSLTSLNLVRNPVFEMKEQSWCRPSNCLCTLILLSLAEICASSSKIYCNSLSKGVCLHAYILTAIHDVCSLESTEISLRARWVDGSYCVSEGVQTSLDLSNPK